MKLRPVLLLPAVALRTTAVALRVFAATGHRLADLISPDSDAATVTDAPPRSAATRPTPQRPAADPQASQSARVDLESLAARPAPEVISALDTLSAEELADLYEHESKHRRRRQVLDAITAATAPPLSAADTGEDLSLLDDAREPDELVYTTQTPRR